MTAYCKREIRPVSWSQSPFCEGATKWDQLRGHSHSFAEAVWLGVVRTVDIALILTFIEVIWQESHLVQDTQMNFSNSIWISCSGPTSRVKRMVQVPNQEQSTDFRMGREIFGSSVALEATVSWFFSSICKSIFGSKVRLRSWFFFEIFFVFCQNCGCVARVSGWPLRPELKFIRLERSYLNMEGKCSYCSHWRMLYVLWWKTLCIWRLRWQR